LVSVFDPSFFSFPVYLGGPVNGHILCE
jgi:hypothetical protein